MLSEIERAPCAASSIRQWSDIIRDRVMPLEITSPRDRFAAHLARREIGRMQVFFIRAEEQYVSRPGRVALDDERRFFLMQSRRAGHAVEHCGREIDLGPGECMLLDSAMPFRFAFPTGADNLLISLPTSLLRTWMPLPEAAAGRPIAADGWGSAFCAFMSNITRETIDGLVVPDTVIGDQIMGLFSLASASEPPACGTNAGMILRRIRTEMAERCAELDLGPATMAREAGISLRYLHTLFAQTGTTFGTELIGFRLEKAGRMLRNRRFREIGIAEIAARCGFRDASHFTRRFRARFGCTPRDFARGAN